MNKTSQPTMNCSRIRTMPLAVALTALLVGACSGTSGGKGVPSSRETGGGTSSGKSRYSLKVYVKEEGEFQLHELSYQNAAQRQGDRSVQGASDSLKPSSGEVRVKDQAFLVNATGDVSDYYDNPYWLLNVVTDTCRREFRKAAGITWDADIPGFGRHGYFGHLQGGKFLSSYWEQKEGGPEENFDEYHQWYTLRFSTWADGQGPIGLIDETLFAQSQLLCIASRLEELATAVSPVTLQWDQGQDLEVPVQVVVLPQNSADRYLITQLELETLAAFGHLGFEGPGLDKYDTFLADPSLVSQQEYLDTIGISNFPGLPNYANHYPSIRDRAVLHLQQHSVALDLLKDLLERATNDRISEALQLRSEGGLDLMWGASDEKTDTVPNSLRGAASLLVGRLEVDPLPHNGRYQSSEAFYGIAPISGEIHGNQITAYAPSHDPQCAGVARLKDFPDEQDIFDVQPAVFQARLADLPPQTLSQQRAQRIVEHLGVLLQAEDIKVGGLLPMIRQQLAISDAVNAGLGTTFTQLMTPPENGGLPPIAEMEAQRSEAYDAMLDGLTEEDFVFALKTNLALAVQLFENSYRDFPPSAIRGYAGFTDYDDLAGDHLKVLSQNDGDRRGVLAPSVSEGEPPRLEGLSREALNTSYYTRVAPAAAASQCDSSHTSAYRMVSSYQDVATLARAIYGNAIAITHSGDAKIDRVRDSLVAKYQSTHAVHGLSHVEVQPYILGDAGLWTFVVRGSAAGAGVDSLGQLPFRILYSSRPWEAECVAGLRTVCRSFEHELTIVGTEDGTDVEGDYVRFVAQADPDATSIGVLTGNDDIGKTKALFYVVLEPRNGQRGEVLAAFRPTFGVVVQGVSKLQRDLLARILSSTSAQATSDSCLESSGAAELTATCVEGIEKHQYVPLASSTDSDSGGATEDSWKHYLGLAKESAAKADELGRQLIELGTTRDLRAESAQETIAGICGDPVHVATLDLSDGTVTSEDQSKINSCVRPETFPVVFFQGSNATISTSSNAEYYEGVVQNTLLSQHKCTNDTGAPSAEDCGGFGVLPCACYTADKMQGLRMDPPPGATRPPGLPGCAELLGEELDDSGNPVPNSGSRFRQGFLDVEDFDSGWFGDMVLKEPYSDAALAGALEKYQFVEDLRTGTWVVSLNGSLPLFAGRHEEDPPELEITVGDVSAAESGPKSAFPLCKRVRVNDPEETAGQHCSDAAKRVEENLGYRGKSMTPQEWLDLEIKLRPMLEGGLWHMARLTGGLPAGVFSLAIPAYNYESSLADDEDETEWPALYSKAAYTLIDNYYQLHPQAKFFDTDSRSMPKTMVPLPRWQASYKAGVERSDAGEVFPRFRFYQEAWAHLTENPTSDAYLAMQVENSARTFEPLRNYSGSTEFLHANLEQWLQDVTGNSPTDRIEAFLESSRALNFGNAPRGVELFKDGVLNAFVVRRKPACHKKDKKGTELNPPLAFGKLGDLLPIDGNEDHLTVLWPSPCDDDNDGWVTRGCLQTNKMEGVGDCHDDGSNVICSAGAGEWPKLGGTQTDTYDQYDDCIERWSRYEQILASSTVWPPQARVHLYIDPGRSAEDALMGMGLLSCYAEDSSASRSVAVPQVNNVQQIPSVRQWVEMKAEAFANDQKKMFLLDVPKAVVDYFNQGGLHQSVGGGEVSDQMLSMAQAFETVNSGFAGVYVGVRAMGDAVRNAEIALTSAEIQRDQEKSQLAVQRINAIGRIASSTLKAAGAAYSAINGNAAAGFEAAASAADAAAAGATLPEYGKQEGNVEKQYDNSIDRVLQTMTEGVQAGLAQAQEGMTKIRTARLDALRVQNRLEGLQNQAAYQVAKATGGDGIDLDGDGTIERELPVNIVYRRHYDILKRRYERALESAKRYAYLARLSVEQRLGVRLETIGSDIGPLPAPSTWADDVCRVQGINYEDLRSLDSLQDWKDDDGSIFEPSENEVIGRFANQFVGDYVSQLEEFVEFYQIQYPFQTENDAAVISMRDDLVYGNGSCRRESKNLLYFSDALGHKNSVDDDDDDDSNLSLEGWTTTRGESDIFEYVDSDGLTRTEVVTAGLQVHDDVELYTAIAGDPESLGLPYEIDGGTSLLKGYIPAPGLSAGLSLLMSVPSVEIFPESTEEEVRDELEGSGRYAPENAVYQSIWLEAGAFYRLSWVDQGRSPLGGAATQGATYRVTVVDEDWSPLLVADYSAGGNWSERHVEDLYVAKEGYYHVVYQVQPDEGLDAELEGTTLNVTQSLQTSVAISSVQLEFADAGGLLDYEPTGSTRMISAFDCGKGNGRLFRSSFERRCEDGQCYYELTKPIQLTDLDIDKGRYGLPGLAEQNFNYRHSTVALNFVGTGVLDCEGNNEGCYANGYVEYDLKHSAFNAALRDYGDEPHCFNFGEGEIRHAKALATERFLGVPLSSSDAQLISGPDFSKRAFQGRPLTGSYTLRIHETPQFRWENLEDVQLVLNYSYWSRVKTGRN